MKFVKKPIVIDAIQWTGKNIEEIAKLDLFNSVSWDEFSPLTIETLEGTMTADIGDWIICGIHKELYPCKSDIFWKIYEPVNCEIERSIPSEEELKEVE